MQAIQTKYLGPTNHRGARIKATCAAGSKIIPWVYDRDVEENHRWAAHVFLFELGWKTTFATGSLPDGSYVHVFVDPAQFDASKSLAEEVIKWASEPRDHGGNPYCYKFVRIAQKITGAE